MSNQTKNIDWQKVIAHLDLLGDCKDYLFRSVTADDNYERQFWGRKFKAAYKKLKKMEANK